MKLFLVLTILAFCIAGCSSQAHGNDTTAKPAAQVSEPNGDKQSWAVAKGMFDGKPVFERFRADIKQPDPRYPYQATFIVPFKKPDANGLFAPSEVVVLDSFEDNLVKQIEEPGDGIMVSVHTLKGARHFVFYTKEDMRVKAEEIAKNAPEGYQIGGEIAKDPEWTLFMGTINRLSKK